MDGKLNQVIMYSKLKTINLTHIQKNLQPASGHPYHFIKVHIQQITRLTYKF
jgi:hypothetical protein